MFVCLFDCLFVWLVVCLVVCLIVCLFVCLFVCLVVWLLVWSFVWLFVCLVVCFFLLICFDPSIAVFQANTWVDCVVSLSLHKKTATRDPKVAKQPCETHWIQVHHWYLLKL